MKRQITIAAALTLVVALAAVSAFADRPNDAPMSESRAYLHSYNLQSSKVAESPFA